MQSVEEQSASNANLLSFKASDVLLIHYLSSFHGFVPIKSVNVAHTEDMDDVMIGARVICWDREGTVASGYGMFACCLYCERDAQVLHFGRYVYLKNVLHLNSTECPGILYCTYCTCQN